MKRGMDMPAISLVHRISTTACMHLSSLMCKNNLKQKKCFSYDDQQCEKL
uniref:Uncharacterized protein n=1 Tax=Anguilla anguilla TaxID=7936 RepID=A0A0E9WF11_ANGAN